MYQFRDFAPAGNAPAARLRGTGAFGIAAPGAKPAPRPHFSLVVDLGSGIGSRQWLRGLATCGALCFAAWSFWPAMATTPGLSPPPLAPDLREENDALAIAPAAFGSATGRRMAPTDAVQPLADAPERPTIDIRATLAAAGDIVATLTRSGVSQDEAQAIAAMIASAVPLNDIAAGTLLDLRLGRRLSMTAPRPVERLTLRATFGMKIEIQRTAGQLALNRQPIDVDSTPLRIQGTIGGSLYRSARAAGVPPRIVEAYIRALAGHVGVPGGLGAGDRFDIIVEHRRAATGETQTGNLLYAGLDRATGRDIQLMAWTVGGSKQWMEASGVGRESSSGFRMPVHGRVTSNFGRRVHPILRYARFHAGMDFGAPYGAPIMAAASGQVVSSGWQGGYGRAVKISHGGGIQTLYGHMSSLAVAPGQQVAAGQVIGYVGSSGFSTGPHLHYELHRNGRPIDPASFRFTTRAALSGGELASFRARMQSLLATPVGAAPAADRVTFAGVGATPTSLR
ncbi:M23 family metallopeptidase [Sphingosinicella sp. YJ22]|uniref:M23 family metallopeptidase n=1 Tax=Sphingosinicella sp. YJ22 TaxID=1104780 RepID=UPI00140AADE3|nr:M23 family metallopeptidase [Sphingosinicella sp. YJ22]